ncbi:MAG: hypothetical protein QXS81_04650 [Candidatus Micrarchaeaceae archaeon]
MEKEKDIFYFIKEGNVKGVESRLSEADKVKEGITPLQLARRELDKVPMENDEYTQAEIERRERIVSMLENEENRY